MSKLKTIVLAYPVLNRDPKLDLATATDDERYVYRVVKVKNSTEYSPNADLKSAEVDKLCASPDWDVTIQPYK